MWALVNIGREDLIDAAIAKRPESLKEREPISKETALHRAVVVNKVEILKKLLLHISPNDTNYIGRTPLHLAVANGLVAAVEVLIQYHVDINRADIWQDTALLIAQKNKHFDIAVMLIVAGADLNNQRLEIQYLFFGAVEQGNVAATSRLIEQGANVMAKNEQGRTALEIAKEMDNGELMQVVVSSKTFLRNLDGEDGLGTLGSTLPSFRMPDDIR